MPTEPPPNPFDPVEQKIRDARDRGEFDGLPGAGKPFDDLDREYDPGWWAKRFLEKMNAEDAAIDLRREIDRELPRLKVLASAEELAERVAAWNEVISELNNRLPPEDQLDPVTL